ncbi:MAG: TRZ/ATZ family hydrolase [Pseudomonadota bacterium]
MKTIDSLISSPWIIPVDAQSSVLQDHGIAIDKGKIVAIAPLDELNTGYQAKTTRHLDNHIVTPGLVNAHTHAAMSMFRGYADDLPLMQWLQDHIWPAESQWVRPEFMDVGTDLAIAEMIRGGTTCFNDMYFFPDHVAKCAENAGIRSVIGMIVIDFPTVWAKDADEYISKGLEVRDSLRHSSLVTAVFAPHAPYTVSTDALERIGVLAEELDCQVHMHVHETKFEIEQSNAQYGMRPLERLEQIGLLSPRLLAVHMTQLLKAEIESLSERGVSVIHCPQSNMKLASGFCPVADLLDADINLAIGTDGAASNNDLDILDETRSAALIAKGFSGDASSMPAYTALRCATLNGAKALGIDHITGSIEVGKAADIAAFDINRVSTTPVFNPVSTLIYSTAAQQASDVWVAGEPLLSDGVLQTLDETDICRRAVQLANAIANGK